MEKKGYLELYQEMVIIRLVEERSAELYQQGKIGGFLHLYIGQEAVCSGITSVRQPQDRIITAYRDHGWALSAGIDPKNVMAELLGKQDGCSKGKGGSMHMADTEKNFSYPYCSWDGTWGCLSGKRRCCHHLHVRRGGDQYRFLSRRIEPEQSLAFTRPLGV